MTFDLDVRTVPERLKRGDDLVLYVTVTNTADTEVTQPVTLDLGNGILDSRMVTIAANDSTTINLRLSTEGIGVGEFTAHVSTEDDDADMVHFIVEDKTIRLRTSAGDSGLPLIDRVQDATNIGPNSQ